jgi:hypothetical protein
MPPSRLSTDETGSASLEFITAGLLLLLPVVYLVLTLAAVQAGAFAAEGAARQAARVYVQGSTSAEADAAAARAIEFALADYGLDAADVTVAVSCTESPCLTRRGFVTITVSTTVALPLVPPFLSLDTPPSIPVTSTATQQVSRFWGAR